MLSPDGKMRKTDVATAKEIFEKEFYIQVIKETFYKKWVDEYIINN